jgi:hypothetical protein
VTWGQGQGGQSHHLLSNSISSIHLSTQHVLVTSLFYIAPPREPLQRTLTLGSITPTTRSHRPTP